MDAGEEGPAQRLLVIEIFAGLLPGAVAIELIGLVAEHAYVETDKYATSVIQTQWPSAEALAGKPDAQDIDRSDIFELVKRKRPTKIFLFGGPPCQDVSKANPTGQGAFGPRSCLRQQHSDIYGWLQ